MEFSCLALLGHHSGYIRLVDFLLVMEFSCLALLGHHSGYIRLVDFLLLLLVVLLIKIVLPISPPSEIFRVF